MPPTLSPPSRPPPHYIPPPPHSLPLFPPIPHSSPLPSPTVPFSPTIPHSSPINPTGCPFFPLSPSLSLFNLSYPLACMYVISYSEPVTTSCSFTRSSLQIIPAELRERWQSDLEGLDKRLGGTSDHPISSLLIMLGGNRTWRAWTRGWGAPATIPSPVY